MADNIFYFNPTCELAIANGSFSYMPPRLLRDFENDCAELPFLFASPNDFILTETKPSYEFIQKLTDTGFQMPVFAPMKELLAKSSFNHLLPWGWSPAAHFILKSLKDKCSSNFKNSPVFNWNEMHKTLFERKTSLSFLNNLLENHPLNFFIGRESTGIIVTSIAETELLLNKKFPLVLKAPLSSSGRGIQIIRKAELNTSNRQWISGVLSQQGYLVAEPYLEKRLDLSFQFSINDSGKPEYLGHSIFETNTNGQYKSTLIHPKISRLLPEEPYMEVNAMIEITAELMLQNLSKSIFSTWHRGWLGVDAMLYKDGKDLKIQPCVEINSRMNMGILAMQLENLLHPEASGKFELFYGKQGLYQKYAGNMENKKPLRFKGGQLYSGFLTLTEPGPAKQFGACLQIEGL
jgi:hypothetical protein